MTAAIAKIVWWVGAVAWFVIMYPHIRRSRKTPTTQRPEPARQRVLMLAGQRDQVGVTQHAAMIVAGMVL